MDLPRDTRTATIGPDGRRGSFEVPPDPTGGGSVTERVIQAVAAVKNLESTEVESPHHRLDTDALDAIFGPRADGRPRTDGHVRFTLDGCTVVVHADGGVEVFPPETVRPRRSPGLDEPRPGE